MKRILINLLITLIALVANAEKDVTQFLGIPVDGTKSEMIQKLKAKGFKTSSTDPEFLEGEFNGTPVKITVVTNGNKVWRIAVFDEIKLNEQLIKNRFNNLCYQFLNNGKYSTIPELCKLIPEDEDVKYETIVHNKEYQALFFQKSANYDDELRSFYLTKYSPEELNNPTKEIEDYLPIMELYYIRDNCLHKNVWIKIIELNGKYNIAIFYDNEKNKANGEDL